MKTLKKQYTLYSKTLKQFLTEYPQDGNVQWGDLDSAQRYDILNARAACRLMGNKNLVVFKLVGDK